MKNNTSKKNSALKVILIVVIMVLFASVSLAAAFMQFYKPSTGSEVPFNTDPVETEGSVNPDETIDPADTEEVQTTAPEQGQGKYEQIKGTYNFLIVGYDKVAANTDVIMIVNFNVNTGSMSILQIPRDTYIDAEITKYHRINTVYHQSLGKHKESKTQSLDALKDLEKTLEESLCINIQNSAIMDLEGFVKIIDALGGVEVDIPTKMDYDDPEQDLHIHLKPGRQVLSGNDAEGFVRFRDTYKNADISRLDAQKIFMSSLIKQAREMDLVTLTRVLKEVITYVVTDMSVTDCTYFAKEAMGIDLENVTMMTLPTSPIWSSSGAAYIIMNRAATLEIINNHFNVYNREITDSIFDRNLIFTEETDSQVHKYYKAPVSEFKGYNAEYNAQEIIDDSINLY